MSERELQDAVIELAALLGYLCHHSLPARTSRGWRTALQGNEGAPDLLLVGNGRVIHAELKSEKGKLSVAQECWASALSRAGAEYYVWRPRHWTSGVIEATLRSTRPNDAVVGRRVRSAQAHEA